MFTESDLNQQQLEAVTASPGPVLVLAGPGSGKTRVLTYRILFQVLELGVRGSEIVAVTFTNKAAREMQSRLEGLLSADPQGAAELQYLSVGTFHALCARMLRREAERAGISRDFVIYDAADQNGVIKQAIKDLNLDPKQVQPGKVHAAISTAKNEMIEPQHYISDTYFGEIVRRVYERYQILLREYNALDFDDLLLETVYLLQRDEELRYKLQPRFAHLLVDEFQDTNSVQYALLRLLASSEPDLFAVGDADQSIYRWRGADYRNVKRFQEDYPGARLILLEQNYRSTQTILDTAMAVIDRIPGRQPKKLFTERSGGQQVRLHEAYDESDESQFIVETIASLTLLNEYEPGDCAVMYRTNAQSRAVEEAFLRAGLPYRLVGAQRFYGRREIKDLIAYLRLIHNPVDQISILRVLNTPPRGIGAKTVENLLNTASRYHLSPAEVTLRLASDESSDLASQFDARAGKALRSFGSLLLRWQSQRGAISLVELMDLVLDDTGYREFLDDGTEEGQERWANVLELRDVAAEYQDIGLTTFLEHVALISDQDTLTETQNAPILMTLHAAKGLEFPVVFIVGLDEGLMPHDRSKDDAEEMAEERRLFYVGITRAQDRLYLVRASRRRQYGIFEVTEPSRFLYDIPEDLVDGELESRHSAKEIWYDRQTTWEPAEPIVTSAGYRTGMRVLHPSFGEGIVLSSRVDFDDEEVTVEFEKVGTKHLVASLANLEVLEE